MKSSHACKQLHPTHSWGWQVGYALPLPSGGGTVGKQHDVRGLDLHVVSHTPVSSLINTHSFNDQYWIVDENMH